MLNFREFCNESILSNSIDLLFEEVVKVPHFTSMPKEQLRKVFKENDLMHKIIASKFVKGDKDNQYQFRLVSSNEEGTMFATYDLFIKWDIDKKDLSAEIVANPVAVFRKEKEAKDAL